jgi:hypothetical protein
LSTAISIEKLEGRIRTLLIAVLCLAATNVLLLAWLVLRSSGEGVRPSEASPQAVMPSLEISSQSSFADRLKEASVVLLVEHRLQDGNVHAFLKEQLKKRAGTEFDLGVGAEFTPLMHKAEPSTRYGEGALVLLAGSPAELRESISIHGGVLSVKSRGGGGFENMSLPEVRRLVQQAP